MKIKLKQHAPRLGAAAFTALVGLSLYSIISNNADKSKHAISSPLTQSQPSSGEPFIASPLSLTQQALTDDDGVLSGVDRALAPEVIVDLLGHDDQIVKAFKVNDLHAWIVRDTTTGEIDAYLTTQNDRYVMTREFLYKNSKGQTANLIEQIAKRYSFDMGASMQWGLLEESDYIQEGAPDAKTVYVFFDPNCRFCHLTWLAFKPYVDAGNVDLRWIPVAMLDEQTSPKQIAYLLQSENPRERFNQSQLAWDISDANAPSSFPLAETISVESAFKLDRNNQFLDDFDVTVTPSFVYKDQEGRVTLASGSLLLEQIPIVLGAQEINNNDPRLTLLRKKQ